MRADEPERDDVIDLGVVDDEDEVAQEPAPPGSRWSRLRAARVPAPTVALLLAAVAALGGLAGLRLADARSAGPVRLVAVVSDAFIGGGAAGEGRYRFEASVLVINDGDEAVNVRALRGGDHGLTFEAPADDRWIDPGIAETIPATVTGVCDDLSPHRPVTLEADTQLRRFDGERETHRVRVSLTVRYTSWHETLVLICERATGG